jgi:tetratricopeptide (TPR) repeat protein
MIFCCLLLLFAPMGAHAEEVQQAKKLYYQGIYGDKAAGEKADKLFANLHQQLPDDPLVTVYYGSLRLLEAQHTWALWKKNSLSKEGVQFIDSAVRAAPNNLEVRFVRAATDRHLPSFFGRKQQVQSDLDIIVRRAEEAVHQGHFDPQLAAASFFYYGELCQEQSRPKEAADAWKTAARIAPDSHAGHAARSKLR